MPLFQTSTAAATSSTFLDQLIYRAGFDKDEITILPRRDGSWLILLPPELDPAQFKVRDLGHMIKAYGVECKMAALKPIPAP